MNTQTQDIQPAMPVMAYTTTKTFAFYAIADKTESRSYSIVKVINITADKIKVSQYGKVFKHLPKSINDDELGQSVAQYWIDINEFTSWQPKPIELHESGDFNIVTL